MNTENNKLIAEFLGLKIEKDLVYIPKYNSGDWEKISKLKYDTDWNDLMKVVEKIENSQANVEIKSHWSPFVEANIHQTTIKVFEYTKMHTAYSSEEVVTIYTNPNRNKLENVYEGVVKFIEWYNK